MRVTGRVVAYDQIIEDQASIGSSGAISVHSKWIRGTVYNRGKKIASKSYAAK
jgi:hypothetical protein